MTAEAEADFYAMEVVFTVIFALELAINLFGTWFWPFVTDGWAIFDFIVVTVGVVSLIVGEMPGPCLPSAPARARARARGRAQAQA